MKNQNDMIISIVAVVLALIVAGVLFATQPEVPAQNPVSPVNIAPAQLPAGSVVMANSLPNAGGGVRGGAPAAPGGRGGAGTAVPKKGLESGLLKVGS